MKNTTVNGTIILEVIVLEFMSTKEAVKKWHLSERRIRQLLESGRVLGAFKNGNSWNIPINALKPADKRKSKAYQSVIEIKDVQKLFEKRDKDANKGNFGKVGILGGSEKYSGAVKLANMSLATLRGGAGLVRVIVPRTTFAAIAPYLLEQTLFLYDNLEDIKEAIKDLDVLAIGMGWDKKEEHLVYLKYILENFSGRIVIDADGLNTLVGHLDLLTKTKNNNANIVLTPHLKEFSRLIGKDIPTIKANAVSFARSFAFKNQVILLLKGSTTIITDGKEVHSVKYGTPGMATSGSGDFLSGIILGLLGYHDFNLLTISAAALLNGLAGQLAEEVNTDIAMIASDTVKAIPLAIKKIRDKK